MELPTPSFLPLQREEEASLVKAKEAAEEDKETQGYKLDTTTKLLNVIVPYGNYTTITLRADSRGDGQIESQ